MAREAAPVDGQPSNAVQALQTELEVLKSRVAALEAAAEEPPSA